MEKINDEEIAGLILDENTISAKDFVIGNDDKIVVPINTNNEKHFYNQGTKRTPKTNWSCGVFGSLGSISDLTGYEFTEEDLKEANQLAIDKYGLKIPGGMYMSKAVDCARDYWNAKFPDKQIASYRTTIGSDLFAEGLQKKHTFVVGYKTSSEYSKDSQDDGIVTGENFPKNGGHLVRTNFDQVIKIDDNYFGTKKWNTYTNNKIKELKRNGVFFPSAYLFLFKDAIKDEIRNNIDLDGAKNQYDKKNWNGLEPRKPMTRQEVMTVIDRLDKKHEKEIADLKEIIKNLQK